MDRAEIVYISFCQMPIKIQRKGKVEKTVVDLFMVFLCVLCIVCGGFLVVDTTKKPPQRTQRTQRKKVDSLCDLRVLCGEIFLSR